MPSSRALYLATKYGPTAYKYGRKAYGYLKRGYKRRYAVRGRRPYLRGGRMRTGRSRRKALFTRAPIGQRVGSHTSKTHGIVNADTELRNTRTLYVTNVTVLTKGDDIDQRERNSINLRGVKIESFNTNKLGRPMVLHFALVFPKTESTVSTTNFFRQNFGAERGADFGTPLTANEFNNLGINTDKFVVLKHMRYHLNEDSHNQDFRNYNGSNYASVRKYMKVGRQLQYEQNTATIPTNGNIFVCFWTDEVNAAAGSPALVDAWEHDLRIITYFREPKH